METKSLLRRSAVALAGVAIFGIGLAGPSSASESECASNQLCGWHNQGYTGTFKGYASSQDALGSHGDEFHSLKNTSPVAWYVRNAADQVGQAYCIRPGHKVHNLDDWHDLGDRISSISRRASSSACQAGTIQIGSPTGF